VQYRNQKFKPTDGTSWVRLTVINADARQASFGDETNFYRHPGTVIVSIFAPIAKGDKEALQLADTVANIFRNWSHSATGIRFQVPPSIKTIGEDKPWFHVNVICPYIRDTLF
jgi:hypothetical protein